MAGVSAVPASALPISSPARDGCCRDLVVSAISASDMPISQPDAGRPPPGSCSSRNFRKRYANLAAQRGTAAARILQFPQFPQAICQSRSPARDGRRQDPVVPAISASDMPMAVAWRGRRAKENCASTNRGDRKFFAPHGGPEFQARPRAVPRTMALREIIQACEHDADPVQVGLTEHTPQHCSGTSRIRRARWLHFGFARQFLRTGIGGPGERSASAVHHEQGHAHRRC